MEGIKMLSDETFIRWKIKSRPRMLCFCMNHSSHQPFADQTHTDAAELLFLHRMKEFTVSGFCLHGPLSWGCFINAITRSEREDCASMSHHSQNEKALKWSSSPAGTFSSKDAGILVPALHLLSSRLLRSSLDVSSAERAGLFISICFCVSAGISPTALGGIMDVHGAATCITISHLPAPRSCLIDQWMYVHENS